MRKVWCARLVSTSLIGVCALAILGASPARAAFLGLGGGTPDIGVAGLNVTYTFAGGVGTFTAANPTSPTVLTLDDGSTVTPFLGNYSLTATIDTATQQVTSGTVTIVDISGPNDLTANVYDFGFVDEGGGNPDKWDFLSTISASSVAGLGVGQRLYTVFPNLGSTFTSLTAPFTAANVDADNRALSVPMPAPLALMLAGLVGLAVRKRSL